MEKSRQCELHQPDHRDVIMDWKTIAENKRNLIIDKIPEEWRIPSFPPPEAIYANILLRER